MSDQVGSNKGAQTAAVARLQRGFERAMMKVCVVSAITAKDKENQWCFLAGYCPIVSVKVRRLGTLLLPQCLPEKRGFMQGSIN